MSVIRLFNPSSELPADRRLTVGKVVSLYVAYDRQRSQSVEAVEERARLLHLFANQFGARIVCDMIPGDLEDWILAHPDWKSGHTKNRVANAVKAAFGWAARGKRIESNPFAGVRFRRGRRGRDLRDQELSALLRSASPLFRRIILYLVMTGSRPAEFRNLLWSQVDAELQLVLLSEHKTADTTDEYRPRRILLCQSVLKLLTWMRRRAAGQDHVFLNACGRPWTCNAICLHLRRLRKRAKLPKDVKLYCCRHMYGTNAILKGVDVATLKELMGHGDIRSTEIYLHIGGRLDHLRKAAEKASRR